MSTQRRRFQFKHFLVCSALLHLVFTSGVYLSALMKERPLPPQTVQFEIVTPTPTVDQKTNTRAAKKPIEALKHQIVDQDQRALNDEIPEDARFLSKNNQVVKKQTLARERGEFKNKQSKETEKGEENAKTKSLSKVDLIPRFDVAKSVQERVEREEQFEKAAADGFLAPTQEKQAAAVAAAAAKGGSPSKGAEVSQSLDYIKNLDTGLETLLSTKEFVYYSYFNRIRSQLNQYWSDKVRLKLSEMYKKGRMIASSDDKVTKCLITLDTAGKLIKVQIIGDSGIHELDEAAVEAFKAAAPFPNPPRGMVDADGTIKIRWDFILEA